MSKEQAYKVVRGLTASLDVVGYVRVSGDGGVEVGDDVAEGTASDNWHL